MAQFTWGPEFIKINYDLLEAYSRAKDGAGECREGLVIIALYFHCHLHSS